MSDSQTMPGRPHCKVRTTHVRPLQEEHQSVLRRRKELYTDAACTREDTCALRWYIIAVGTDSSSVLDYINIYQWPLTPKLGADMETNPAGQFFM